MRFTIQRKINAIILAVLCTLLLFAGVHFLWMRSVDLRDAGERNLQISLSVANDLDHLVEKSRAIARTLARHPAVRSRNMSQADQLFAELLPLYPFHFNIVAADMRGRNYGSALHPERARTVDHGRMEWFQQARTGASVVDDGHRSGLHDETAVMIAEPVMSSGRQVGVVGLSLDIASLREAIAREWWLPDGGSIDIIDSKGEVLACVLFSGAEFHAGGDENGCFVTEQFRNGSGSLEATGPDGVDRLYSYTQIKSVNWSVVTGIPIEPAYAKTAATTRNFIFMLFIGAGVAVVLGILLRLTITRNVGQLTEGLKAIEAGDLAHRIQAQGNDELSDMAASFNRMADQREQAERDLLRANRALRVLSICNEALVRVDDEQELLQVICDTIVREGGYRVCWVGYAVDAEGRPVRSVAAAGISREELEALSVSQDEEPERKGPVCRAISTGAPVIIRDLSSEPGFGPWREAAQRYGYRSGIGLPLIQDGQAFGGLGIFSEQPDAFGGSEVRLLTELANDLAFGISAIRTRNDREEKDRLIGSIFAGMGEGLIVVDRQYRILAANGEYCRQVGREEASVVGRPCYEVSHGSERHCTENGEDCAAARCFETGRSHTAVHVHRHGESDVSYVEIRSFPIRDASGAVTSVIEILNDVTERRRLEEQLRQSQKLEAVGTLAGGVAHDFNNILSAVIGYAHIALMKAGEDDPLRHDLEQVLAASERATTLTQSLLAFSRKQPIRTEPVAVNDIVSRFEKFLRRLVREDIEMRLELDRDEATVMADRGQMEQVLMNLVTNARDAMPQGGRLTIRTGRAALDESFIQAHGYGAVGAFATLVVTDTGTGMDQATQRNIFEPFFTTKEQGKGTGLGLSMVYGIVKKHDGFINVYSEPGRGATFRIYLPLVAMQASSASDVAGREDTAVLGGRETVMVAEDDEALRRLTATVLRHFGYTVLEAKDGEDAVQVFSRHRDAISLVVLDGIMPKKNGRETLREIRALRPDMRTILVSGYADGLFEGEDQRGPGLLFLQKPLSPQTLARSVRAMLDGGAGSEAIADETRPV